MVVLRVIGAAMVGVAVAILGWDIWNAVQGAPFHWSPLGKLWLLIDYASLDRAHVAVAQSIAAPLWDPMLLWPAALVFGIPGLTLWGLGSVRRRDSL